MSNVSMPGRIMVVDDDDAMRDVMQIALQSGGATKIMLCRDADMAVTAAEQFRPNLILLDLRMPHKDGPATLKMMHEVKVLQNVPIIFTTGVHKVSMIDDYARLGVIGVIHKPFTGSELRKKISELWAHYNMNLIAKN